MQFKTLEEHLSDAKELVRAHGHLPHCTWLRKNGYQALYQITRLYPAKFTKFPRPERKYRHLQDWLEIAKKLAKKNKEKIPTVTWLLEHGYSMLCRQMQKNPQAFSAIEQERHFRRPDEWVKVAEQLAREHDGIPNTYWLQSKENGYKALDKVMRQHPDIFAHIPRKKLVQPLS